MFLMCVYYTHDCSYLYSNAVLPVMCEGWYFIHMWKTLAGSHHFTLEGGVWSYETSLSRQLFIEVLNCSKPEKLVQSCIYVC
jgi:hypothetical protein